MARESSAADLQQARDRAEAAWAVTKPPRRGRKASKPRQGAAVDCATVDLIEWLSENRSTIDHVQEVGDLLAGHVIEQLEKNYGDSEPRKLRSALNSHFWCDLLVATADGMDKFSQAVGRIPEYVTTAITKSRKSDDRSPLLDPLVALAVRTAWEPIKSMIRTSGNEELQRTCRILAVLICPAPEDHTAVRDGALIPLAKEAISEISRERLEQVFPADWVSRLRKSLGDE
ncbi:hypothetical protein [Microbispora sp. GKU 823]|uniref:hypothetical protein n=1 Tax=Microbispora sp. GKU 823 TaxID=1652100 RepID=UPI00118127F4|nr:hypothetical protein [Microbispora sp. GKU 823]